MPPGKMLLVVSRLLHVFDELPHAMSCVVGEHAERDAAHDGACSSRIGFNKMKKPKTSSKEQMKVPTPESNMIS